MIGVAIPSRGRPNECERAAESLRWNASDPMEIDVVVRVDSDDPCLAEYWNHAEDGRFRVIEGPRGRGYASNHMLINSAASCVHGDLLMQFVDDAEMRTQNWNERYREAIGDREIFVCSANVETPDGSNYEWSFPLIPRRLYELAGRFCLGDNPSVDRCWAAFADNYGCAVHAPVSIYHHHIGAVGKGDKTSQEGRTPFASTIANNPDWYNEHHRVAKEFADKVRASL